ncbi:hypothetical protein PHSY_006476 [Pseudozyma hubeiensis SY62]|uniref:Uncharacterized protein n=1 Tax=Pseudozyma hubeiensis (strain SY62) TaxID=1305764 RepID=R9PBZ2_PSEHS|nr:hypothetical protein PHSY_006476 [Pseudozyma hubeiensis SY62]GAC98881.1 hypothetical protein PHSY_006476 [Pseudozyma hubeiensis SY62]
MVRTKRKGAIFWVSIESVTAVVGQASRRLQKSRLSLRITSVELDTLFTQCTTSSSDDAHRTVKRHVFDIWANTTQAHRRLHCPHILYRTFESSSILQHSTSCLSDDNRAKKPIYNSNRRVNTLSY